MWHWHHLYYYNFNIFFCDPLSPLSNAFIIVQRNGWLMIQRMAFSCMNCFRNIFQNWHKDFYGILFECCCGFWALIKASFPFRNRMLREILAKMYTSEIFFWHSGLIKEPVLISHINFTFLRHSFYITAGIAQILFSVSPWNFIYKSFFSKFIHCVARKTKGLSYLRSLQVTRGQTRSTMWCMHFLLMLKKCASAQICQFRSVEKDDIPVKSKSIWSGDVGTYPFERSFNLDYISFFSATILIVPVVIHLQILVRDRCLYLVEGFVEIVVGNGSNVVSFNGIDLWIVQWPNRTHGSLFAQIWHVCSRISERNNHLMNKFPLENLKPNTILPIGLHGNCLAIGFRQIMGLSLQQIRDDLLSSQHFG